MVISLLNIIVLGYWHSVNGRLNLSADDEGPITAPQGAERHLA
jgi:hypothetical protein